MVEFVLGMAVWVALTAGFITLVQTCLLRQRAHAAARLGAFLLATGRVPDETVRGEVRNYLNVLSRRSDAVWNFEMGRFLGLPAARFYRLVQTRVEAVSPTARVAERVVVEQHEL